MPVAKRTAVSVRSAWSRFTPLLVALGLALVGAGWWFGTVQEFLRFLINWPGFAVALVGALVVAVGISSFSRTTRWRGIAIIAVGALIGCAYLIRLSLWATAFDRRLGESTQPPDSTFLPRRVLPWYVADQFARRSLTDSRYVLGSLQPTMAPDGRLVWQAALVPNSLGTYFTRGVSEVIEVDADTTRPDVRRIPIQLPRGGEGNFMSFYRLIARTIAPLSEMQEPVYDTHARTALVPLIRWIWGIPSFHAVVRFDSVGQVAVLTPLEAARQHPHLRLVPEAMVYWQASRWGDWRRGLFGPITKRGLLEIAGLGNAPRPILLDNRQRASWVVPMEPQGQSFGLAGVLFVDAQTGAVRWWNTADQSVQSPSQAVRVAADDPRIALLKNSVPAEPKLGILGGRVHYLVPILPASGSQVQKLAVVDATSSRTTLGDSYDEVWGSVRQVESANDIRSTAPSDVPTSQRLAERIESMARTISALQAQLDSLRALVARTQQ